MRYIRIVAAAGLDLSGIKLDEGRHNEWACAVKHRRLELPSVAGSREPLVVLAGRMVDFGPGGKVPHAPDGQIYGGKQMAHQTAAVATGLMKAPLQCGRVERAVRR